MSSMQQQNCKIKLHWIILETPLKLCLKFSWNKLDTFFKHPWKFLKTPSKLPRKSLETPFELLLDTHEAPLKHPSRSFRTWSSSVPACFPFYQTISKPPTPTSIWPEEGKVMFFDIFREHVGHFEAIQFLCTPSLVKTKLFLFSMKVSLRLKLNTWHSVLIVAPNTQYSDESHLERMWWCTVYI